jgi:hypothetical protein
VIINSSFFRFSWSEEKERSSCSPRNDDEREEVKYLIFIINKYTVYLNLKLTGIMLQRLKKKKLNIFQYYMSSSYWPIKNPLDLYYAFKQPLNPPFSISQCKVKFYQCEASNFSVKCPSLKIFLSLILKSTVHQRGNLKRGILCMGLVCIQHVLLGELWVCELYLFTTQLVFSKTCFALGHFRSFPLLHSSCDLYQNQFHSSFQYYTQFPAL